MPALQRTTASREAKRAVLAALAGLVGGALWVFAETSTAPVGPASGFEVPTAAVAPAAWGLDQAAWGGLAGLAVNLPTSLAWVFRIIAVLLLACAALAVIHPGVFERPAPYYLPPLRRAIAFGSSLLIGLAMPATLLLLTSALTQEPGAGMAAMDSTATVRIGLGISIFCAFLWALAGRGVLNPRALLRFAHGGVAGLGIFGTLGIAAVATRPLIELAALSRVGNVFSAADAGLGSVGATFGWMLGATMLLYGLACAVSAGIAVTGAPQSVGAQPRMGAGIVTMATLGLMLIAGAAIGGGAHTRAHDASPDLVAELDLSQQAPERPVLLLFGETEAARRVPPRAALTPVELAEDCAPSRLDAERTLPAATEENARKLREFREQLGQELSGRAARALGCEAAIRARLFEPDEARRLIFTDPERARIGYAAFRAGVRGLLENVSTRRARALMGQLADTARYTTTPTIRRRLADLASATDSASSSLTGRLAVPSPESWRVGIVAAGDSSRGLSAWATAPGTDGQVLEWMAAATTPAADGRFSFDGLAAGAYRLALLAPPGTSGAGLARMRVLGDPGRFQLTAGAARDLGTIQLGR